MGAGAASKFHETSEDDVKAAVAELSEEDKGKVLAALKDGASDASKDNTKHIRDNKAKLHELESVVMANKQRLYGERAFIEENRELILMEYTAAFLGNRQMANQNTQDIFRNRKAIVKHYKTGGDAVKINFAASRLNEATIDYLEKRAKMNSRVAHVNELMVKVNKLLIEVNDDIMEGNAEIVEFNSKHIAINTKLLSGELEFKNSDGSPASPEKNQERIERNSKRIAEIAAQASANNDKYNASLTEAKKNRENAIGKVAQIYERRVEIEANHEHIAENAHKISEWILHE